MHKRKYGDAYVTTYGEVPATRELLVGKAISVWWNAEGNFHLGNVVQYHPELVWLEPVGLMRRRGDIHPALVGC